MEMRQAFNSRSGLERARRVLSVCAGIQPLCPSSLTIIACPQDRSWVRQLTEDGVCGGCGEGATFSVHLAGLDQNLGKLRKL
jgi:hypothetical protein